jgi:AraC family transcriptional regulator
LALLSSFLTEACAMQERHTARICALAGAPASSRRASRLRGGLSPAALRRVQLYVEANLDRPIPLADLARRAGLSAYHFARAFKRSMGITPRAFVERRRIARAKALIEDSPLSLAVIATEAGFGTQSRLTTAFRRALGVTPAVYRRGRR